MKRAAPAASSIGDAACACTTARRAAHALTRMYDGCLRSAGLEVPQFALLNMLEKIGPSSQAAMGRQFALDKTTLSRNLKTLAKKGWVKAAPGADARERRFVVTAAGRTRVAAARPGWQTAQRLVCASMRPHDWEAMWRVMKALTEAAQVEM